ncbi:ABC transporter substrate-binding protein [Azospirillum sp. RWY-5-1]|uniref:ABC transporter substrate-binding protein n=1 Tax=Azospirillum oleiclasticum TaxID=2735135 RepID=A0ABX2T5V8_9PROT|nr:ABC transporter substrate-binding protein [Azospirillum oleiclasticum]NYZ11432.1 ABC transporter substrate-binding protein [Azospirillum oleiclasticum]NYZ18593.1 ABC transporter substrate-binding protein [Azospirillum oleiclasticum]
MERREFLTAAGLGLGGSMLAAPLPAAGGTARWDMVMGFPDSMDILHAGAGRLAGRVAALTRGALRIDVRPAGTLVPETAVLDAVSRGDAAMGFTASHQFLDRSPALAFDTGVPFGLNARQQNAWMQHGGGLDLIRETLADHGVVPFPAGHTGTQMGGWFRREIQTMEDFNGLQFRVAGIARDILVRLRAVPQTLGDRDLGPALAAGTIDAGEWGGPHDDLRLGLHRAARFYYYPSFWGGNAQLSCYVNRRTWENLPTDQRAALKAACAETSLWITSRYDAWNPPALKRLLAEGALLRPFGLDILRAAYQATEDHLASLAAGDPQFRKVHDSWKPFRDDQQLWFRIAENSFDRFVSMVSAERNRN